MEGCVGYREVIPDQTRPEKCREFTLNTGGTPSTLQDIKVQQRAGGYSYKTYPDRFIYWRTNHDVLELVEQSLSVNLTSNHVKYRFTDTPILEGVSVHETYNSVIVLVAAVSSVHRLVFPHPDKLPVQQQATIESSIPSIFSEASLSAARDPTTYHILTSSPNLPHTGTSCLTSNGDALFALALGTGVILLVHLEPLSGVVTCNELRQDTVMPRFLSGLTDALLGRNAEDSVPVSLVLHCINNVFYLFGVCRDGQLRVWNCDKGHCLDVHDVTNGAALYAQGGQNHSIRKAIGAKGELLLCIFLGFTNGSRLVIVSPYLESGTFQYTRIATILTPENHDLVEVWLGDKGNHRAVWCIWVTNQGETAISYSLISSTNWVWASLQPAPPFERNLNPMIDPRQAYLDAIFEPGVFSVADINRALSIYRRSGTVSNADNEITSAGDLRQCVCQAVEAEIQVEVSEYELTDDEYLEVADRCWSRFYSCCVQYLQTGTAALGLFWLPATHCIAVVKKTGFSLLRSMDPVEVLTFTDNDVSFGDCQNVIVNSLKLLEEGVDARFKIEAALTNIGSLDAVIAEVAAEIESEKNIRQAIRELEIQLREHLDIQDSIGYLLRMLNMPLPNPAKEGEGEGLNSHLGISTIVLTLDQLVSVRLDMCVKLLLMLELSLGGSLKATWSQRTKALCQQLWTLKWLCRAQFSGHSRSVVNLFSHTAPLLLHKFLLGHEGIAQSSLLNAAAALAYAIWPNNKGNAMAEFLLDTQQYLLLQQFACLVPHESWNIILAQAFLEMGEPHKAFDLVVGESEQYFKIIQMFERHDLPDLVIDLANNAIQKVKCKGDNADLPTLHSILFLHHLKLGHWENAYDSLETNPEESRRIDCLGQLVTELINARQVSTLLEFPYHGLLSNLETFLETRARSLDIEQAAIYYNTLYALYINHENFKKAASVMYEHGLRSETCKAQFRCYGACLNVLHLVHLDNAWIVKPPSSAKDSIVLLELKDIQREYELSKARCALKNCSTDTSPREVVAICVSEGLYKTALRLCHLFKLSYDQPLEALTTACVMMANQDKAWDWLLLNDISDLVVGDENAGTAAWRLLEYLFLKYEEKGLTRLHQVVARKIMSHSAFLPHWLEASYKKRNPGELMRLYIRHGNLQQAGMLAKELLKAGLGAGREHFPMEHSLLPTAPPLWLPLNTIDALLAELQHHPSMKSMEEEVSMMLDKYIETATRVSNDKIAAAVITRREIS